MAVVDRPLPADSLAETPPDCVKGLHFWQTGEIGGTAYWGFDGSTFFSITNYLAEVQ